MWFPQPQESLVLWSSCAEKRRIVRAIYAEKVCTLVRCDQSRCIGRVVAQLASRWRIAGERISPVVRNMEPVIRANRGGRGQAYPCASINGCNHVVGIAEQRCSRLTRSCCADSKRSASKHREGCLAIKVGIELRPKGHVRCNPLPSSSRQCTRTYASCSQHRSTACWRPGC